MEDPASDLGCHISKASEKKRSTAAAASKGANYLDDDGLVQLIMMMVCQIDAHEVQFSVY